MKKFGPALLIAALVMGGCSTGSGTETSTASSSVSETSQAASTSESTAPVMSYQEYVDAELESPVTIEAYVQDKQSWWEDKATLYLADEDGAYFVYNANVSEDLYKELEAGKKVRVSGYKTEWSGETEVAEGADVELIDDAETYIAKPVDVTDLLGNEEELIKHQNQLVTFTGLTIEPASEGSEEAFMYNYDGSGSEGDDLYFNASANGKTYTFTVESYLRGADSDVYKAVKDLKVGDIVDLEGFLYWYEGANPHIISVVLPE